MPMEETQGKDRGNGRGEENALTGHSDREKNPNHGWWADGTTTELIQGGRECGK